jgi:hypothetical protein
MKSEVLTIHYKFAVSSAPAFTNMCQLEVDPMSIRKIQRLAAISRGIDESTDNMTLIIRKACVLLT